MHFLARNLRACGRWAALLGLDILACFAALAVWAVFAPSAFADTPKAPAPVVLPFEAAWGEITLIEGALAFESDEGRYEVGLTGRTRGPLNFISPWRATMNAVGGVDGDGRSPERFDVEAEWRDGSRVATVRYEDGLPAGYEATATDDDGDEDEPRSAVDPADVVGVADALSVFARGLDRVRATDGENCDFTGRVWDGVRLFDVAVETLGPGAAPQDRRWSYAGPTLRCQLTFDRLGGFRTASSRWRSDEDEVLRVIHFAEIDGEWLPVRVEISAPLGDVVARIRVDDATELAAE